MTNLSSYQLSYWEREFFFKNLDVVIIGSGIVGLSAAIRLKELAPESNVIIFERGPLPIGASTRNAGFACFGSMTELLEDLEKQDETTVFDLVAKRWRGLKRLRERLGDQAMDYKNNGGFELFRNKDQHSFKNCVEHIHHFNNLLSSIMDVQQVFSVADDKINSFGFQKVSHLILNCAEGQIHTGKMMGALLTLAYQKGVRIYNGMGIKSIEQFGGEVQLQSNQGWTIRAAKVLIATNGFARQLFPEQQVQPARNQVLITKKIPSLRFKGCFHYEAGYYYFRNIDGRILLGGGRNLNPEEEQTDELGTTEIIQSALKKLLSTVIIPDKKVEIEQWWSGILGVGESKSPILKKIGANIVLAVRLGGMGVAIGSLVGEEGAGLIV